MQSSARESDITPQLEKYWRLAEFFGFTTFAFNSSTRRVAHVQGRFRFLQTMLLSVEVTCAFFLLINITCVAFIYAKFDRHSWEKTSPIVVQEALILGWFFVSQILFFGHLARHFLKSLSLIVPIINETLKIHAVLSKMTDSTLCVPRPLKAAVTARAIMLMYQFVFDLVFHLLLCVVLIGVVQIYGALLTGTALMGHLYSQLVLIGFYTKMAEFLQAAGTRMPKEEFSENVQALLTISFRIHRVKGRLNTLFSALFTSVFFGLSFGICVAYNIWKAVVFGNELAPGWIRLFAGCFWLCVTFFVIIYDLYLICWLSDELVAMERRFMRDMLLHICANRVTDEVQRRWEIHQIMIQSELLKLKSVLFKLIDLNRAFVLDYLFNMAVQHIITCMQFYIGGRYRSGEGKEIVLPGIAGRIGPARTAN